MLPPLIDLSLESRVLPEDSQSKIWVLHVRNGPVRGHSPTSANNVVIRITASANGQEYRATNTGANFLALSTGHFDASTGEWTIPRVLPFGSARAEFNPYVFFSDVYTQDIPVHLHAEIVEYDGSETLGLQANDETEVWYVKDGAAASSFKWAISELRLQSRVSGRYSSGDTSAAFDVLASGYPVQRPTIASDSDFSKDLWDVKVSIELSEGLFFASSLQSPAGTRLETIDTVTRIWDIGHIASHGEFALSVPVIVTTDNIPLAERCLTATTVSANPAFELDLEKQANNVVTVCLGDDPPVVMSEGDIILWWLHDCFGGTDSLCGGNDGLKLFARADHDEVSLPTTSRLDIFGGAGSAAVTYFDPRRVIVQVSDPQGRIYDNRSHSLTDANTVSWQTASKESSIIHPGIRVWYSRTGFNNNIGDWSNVVRTVSVSGLDGATTPGRVRVRHDNSSTSTFYDPAPPSYTHMRAPFNLTSTTANHNDYILEFTSLGTYVVNFHALATRTDSTEYNASGDYIFHVGPIAELAVWDGGKGSPLATADQAAYTIHAATNGPDPASAVQVTLTGVPEGAEVITSDGMYQETSCAGGVCEAKWDLGRMIVSDSRPARGQTEYPTLTLIAPDGVPTGDITATIENIEDYEKCIDASGDVPVTGADAAARKAACVATSGNSWHSARYFDYIDDNNTATIMAQPGTGEAVPGVPQDLRGRFFSAPVATAVLWWTEVESLNGWPVSHYEMWQFEDEPGGPCLAPGLGQAGVFAVKGTVYQDRNYNPDASICYYVRAVNTRGVPGYWSEAVTATSQGLDQPVLSLEAGPDVSEGETATFTVRASPAPVAGDTLVVNYTVTQQGGYVAATEEGRKDITIDNRGRATISVPTQGNTADEADGEVTVTLENGLGYTRGTPSTASVAVLDDDNPTVSFAVSPAEPLSEGNYTHNVTVNLDQPSHAALEIHYTLGGDVGDEDVRFAIAGSGRERSVGVPSGATSVDIPVRLLNDDRTRDDTVLNLFLSPRHYYDLGSPASYTLTIIEDDGPRAEFALTESGVDEANGTHNVVVNLNPPADGDVTINYSLNGSTATSGDDYSISDVTGSTGSVSASDEDTSVTISLSIIGDADAEGDETVVLTLLSSPDYTLGDDRKHTVTIRDDDLPRARFAAGASDPGEGKGLHTVRVNLSPPAPPDGLTLSYGVGGTASRNRDYRVDNTTFALGGADSVDIWVEITDDGDHEPDETVVLTLRAGSGYAVGDPGEHTLTIADDDLPLVAFAAAEASASEAAGTHLATILVEPAAHEDFTVSYSVGGTATEGAEEDFTISGLSNGSGTVTVPARASRVQVPVTIRNDEFSDGDETVVLTLTGCDGCNLALPIRHELTIRDDDAPVVSFFEPAESVYEDNIGTHNVRVKLDRPASRAFTLTYSVSSPALIGAGAGDYSVPTPNEAQVIAGRDYVDIPVTITADMDNEADERLVLTLQTGPGYSLGQITEYTLTIMDDDNDENTPVFTMNHPAISGTGRTQSERWEDGGASNPTFYVTHSFTGRVYFRYVGGTATPSGDDKDFTLFNIGDQTIDEAGDIFWVTPGAPFGNDFGRPDVYWARFGFSPRRDDKAEGSETAIFRLLNGPDYRVSGHTDYTITIRNAN